MCGVNTTENYLGQYCEHWDGHILINFHTFIQLKKLVLTPGVFSPSPGSMSYGFLSVTSFVFIRVMYISWVLAISFCARKIHFQSKWTFCLVRRGTIKLKSLIHLFSFLMFSWKCSQTWFHCFCSADVIGVPSFFLDTKIASLSWLMVSFISFCIRIHSGWYPLSINILFRLWVIGSIYEQPENFFRGFPFPLRLSKSPFAIDSWMRSSTKRSIAWVIFRSLLCLTSLTVTLSVKYWLYSFCFWYSITCSVARSALNCLYCFSRWLGVPKPIPSKLK